MWTQFIDEKSYRKMIADENTGTTGIPVGSGRDFEFQFLDMRANRRSILISFARIPETDSSVASITDISELKDAEQRIYFQAVHDALTRLPNRALYQPIVRLSTAEVVGFEALIRWVHPETGMVYPGAFIATAEDAGLIIPITRLTVERACRDLQDWQQILGTELDLTVSVNISSRHFLQPSLLDDLKKILDQSGLPPHLLKLEITETALMAEADDTIRLAHRLRDFGIRLMIDDFRTGYASLSCLQRLPIDTLKVDRSFISRIQEEPESNRNIVEAIVSLAHKLEMSVVAEGIETPEQKAVLVEMGRDYGQSYLFARPMSKADVDAMMAGRKSAPTRPRSSAPQPLQVLAN